MVIGIEAAHANKDQRTGVEEVCFALIQNLQSSIPSDTRVLLYSKDPLRDGLENIPSNWSARILSWPGRKLWSQIRLSWEFVWHCPDIFIAPGQLIPFFCPKNTVVVVHDSAFLVYPEAYNFWGRQYLKWMNKRIVKKAALIVTPSEFSKSELIKYYKLPVEKIVALPLGYDQKKFYILSPVEKDKSVEILRKYNIDKPFLLSINRLETKKNTKRMVEAFNILKKEFDVQLVLVGKPGVGYAEIKLAVEKSPYRDDIKELGWVEDGDLIYLLNSAQLFLLPSLYEGFGIPLLNALASGCPVVASRCCALPEVGGEAVVYVNPEDSGSIAQGAKEILSNATRRRELVELGLRWVKNFSWKKFAEQIWLSINRLPE